MYGIEILFKLETVSQLLTFIGSKDISICCNKQQSAYFFIVKDYGLCIYFIVLICKTLKHSLNHKMYQILL